MKTRVLKGLMVLLPMVCTAAQAAECSAQNGEQVVPLVELFTSEGCSSCPPADSWLSGLDAQGYAADKVVPLGFHVDYWDYIGWADRFAKPEFTSRQRQAVLAGGSRTVYTPQVLLNGKDYRGWTDGGEFSSSVKASQAQAAPVKLGLSIASDAAGALTVNATAAQVNSKTLENAEVYIAVYENNLKSSVDAGENSGRELSHSHVVRELYGPYTLAANGGNFKEQISIKGDWKNRDAGVAAFVQNRDDGAVLQALALKICS